MSQFDIHTSRDPIHECFILVEHGEKKATQRANSETPYFLYLEDTIFMGGIFPIIGSM